MLNLFQHPEISMDSGIRQNDRDGSQNKFGMTNRENPLKYSSSGLRNDKNMSDYPIRHEISGDVGTILAVHDFLLKGAKQYGITRKGNHLIFSACYDVRDGLGKIRHDILEERQIPNRYDTLGGWLYVELDASSEAIAMVQSRELPYLQLVDIGK